MCNLLSSSGLEPNEEGTAYTIPTVRITEEDGSNSYIMDSVKNRQSVRKPLPRAEITPRCFDTRRGRTGSQSDTPSARSDVDATYNSEYSQRRFRAVLDRYADCEVRDGS
jgi:hypothetical protein